jgi:ABC-type transport system substrate-binding protein
MRGHSIRWTAAALVALFALSVGLAACGGSSGGSSGGGSAAASGQPVKGGTLTVSFQGEPTGLDPAIAWESESFAIERLTYQTFLTYAGKPGEAGTELVPDLATEVPSADNSGISADGKVYTFHIHEGVRFAQPISTEVTAADFKWSFERMMNAPRAPATDFYSGIVGAQDFMDGTAGSISGYKVVDPYTVQITLEQPDGAFLMKMSMPFTSVMSKKWCAEVGSQIKRKPLGTGPYVITEWKAGQSITAEKNANWTRDDDQWVDHMQFDFTANPSTQVLRLERGEVDVMGDSLTAPDWVRTKNDPTWSKFTLTASQIAWYYLFMNVLEKPFTDERVRQAVNYAIDTEKIQKLLAGQGSELNQIYPNGMPGHQADKTFYTYDPAKAKSLLAEAGFPNGLTCTFGTHNVDPFPKLAQAIQADLKAVGIDCQIKPMDRATYWTYIGLKKSHAQIGLSDWYMDFPDPSDWIGSLFTNPIEAGANSSFYDSPQVDSLYDQSAGERDPATRIGMYQQMQDIIMTDAPTAPLYQPIWHSMFGKTTGGVYIHPVWIFTYQEYWKTDGK